MNKYLAMIIAAVSLTACTKPTEIPTDVEICEKYIASKKGTPYASDLINMQLDPKDIYDINGKPHLKVGNEYYEIKVMSADEWLKQFDGE